MLWSKIAAFGQEFLSEARWGPENVDTTFDLIKLDLSNVAKTEPPDDSFGLFRNILAPVVLPRDSSCPCATASHQDSPTSTKPADV